MCTTWRTCRTVTSGLTKTDVLLLHLLRPYLHMGADLGHTSIYYSAFDSQVARSSTELEAAVKQLHTTGSRVQWKYRIHESDPAYLWAQCLAPVYGINILGCRAGICFKVCVNLLSLELWSPSSWRTITWAPMLSTVENWLNRLLPHDHIITALFKSSHSPLTSWIILQK